jgi:hypothetical protein
LNKIDASGPLAMWTPLEEGMRILAINHEPCPKSVYELKEILQNSIGFITIHAVEQSQPEWLVENETESEEEYSSDDDHDHYATNYSKYMKASNQPKGRIRRRRRRNEEELDALEEQRDETESEEEESSDHDHCRHDDKYSTNSRTASNQPNGRIRRRRRNEAELDALEEQRNEAESEEEYSSDDDHECSDDEYSNSRTASNQPKGRSRIRRRKDAAELDALEEQRVMQGRKRIFVEYMTTEQQEKGNDSEWSEVVDVHDDENTLVKSSHIKRDSKADPKPRKANALQQPKAEAIAVSPRQQNASNEQNMSPKYCNAEAETLQKPPKPGSPRSERQRIKPILVESVAVPPRQQNTFDEQNMSPKYCDAEAETLHEHPKPCPPRSERQQIKPILESRKHQRQHASPSRKEVSEISKAYNGTIRGSSSYARRAQKNQIVDDLEEDSSLGWDDESNESCRTGNSCQHPHASPSPQKNLIVDDLEEDSSLDWDDDSNESCRKGNRYQHPHASPSPTRRDRLLSHKTQSSKYKHQIFGGKLSSKSIMKSRKRSRDREIRSEKREVYCPKRKSWTDTSRLRKKDETFLISEDRLRRHHHRERTDDTDHDSIWWGFSLFNCGCSSDATDPDLFA